MGIFQTIWTAITTPNDTILSVFGLISCFIEAYVNMQLFTTLLSIDTTKTRKIIHILTFSILGIIARNLIPDPFCVIIIIILGILSVKFILGSTVFKSILAEFLSVGVSALMEIFFLKLYDKAFHIPYDSVMYIPIYRVIFTLSIYLFIYLLYKAVKYFKFKINLDNMNKKSRILFITNAILGLVAIFTQFYLIAFYSHTMPIGITIVSILSLSAYFFISIYSLLSTSKLETTSRDLEEAQLYNKTLIILHDSMRGFKHDFHNIVQGIGGYIDSNDLNGLKKYYSQLLKDCNRNNNLTALNPEVINNPAIYNIMATKYHKADEIGVEINLGIFMDLNEIEKHVKIYEFTRILGILLDNAIEASSECENKVIHVSFRKEENRNRLLMIIENTYLDKNIDVDRIYEKDFSTKSKKTNSGLGLWEVRQILKKNNNLNLYTTKNEEYFIQQFEIYY